VVTAREEVQHRRRVVAIAGAVLALVALVCGAAAGAGHGGSARAPAGAKGAAAATPRPPQLPRGGRDILPRYRVVAYYGNPQDAELGTLGIGTPNAAVQRLERQAKPYGAGGRPVLPALELIAVVAARDPGDGGRYDTRADDATIASYLAAARRAKAVLLLDIQPGRSDFLTEARRLEKWLALPDVGLALDPEWRVSAGQVPGQVIGRVDAAEVNATTGWLESVMTAHDLPQKLVVIHQFTDDMVDEQALVPRRGEAIVLNADGFGGQAIKRAKYRRFTRQAPGFAPGFKLFYKEDVGLMTPAQVLRLRPPPDFVVYE
jgi:hypothetical protein